MIQDNTVRLEEVHGSVPPNVDAIRQIVVRCEDNPELHTVANIIRVLACTGSRFEDFIALRKSDIASSGKWLQVGRGGRNRRIVPIRLLTLEALFSLLRKSS